MDSSAPKNSTATITTVVHVPAESLTLTAPPPEMVSQRNVENVAGIPKRTYLDLLRAPGFPLPVTRVGKLRLVPRVEFVAYLRGLAQQGRAPDELDAFLSSAGLVRVK